MKINREIVESYLGQKVEVKLFDDTTIIGYLFADSTGMSQKNKWYHTVNPNSNIMFRVSHIRSIKKVD